MNLRIGSTANSRAVAVPLAAAHRRATVVTLATLWLSLLLWTGCAAKFIGDYDSTIDSGVSQVQQRAEVYFNKIRSDPSMPYDPNFYIEINAQVASLKTRAHILSQYQILEQQIQELQGQFDRLQTLDKGMTRPFPLGAIDAAESAITTNVESILKLELALKRGDKNAPEKK